MELLVHIKPLIHAALAAALLVLPTVALADQNPTQNNGQYNNGQYNNGQNNNGRRRDDRDDRAGNNGQYNNGQYNNGQYNNGQYNNGYGGTSRIGGTVTGYSSYDLDVNNGPHIRLHQGTVINPTGITLQRGMRIAITGHPNNDGTFEADRIDVVGNSYGTTGNTNQNNGNILGGLGNLGSLGNLSRILGSLKI